MEPPEDLVNAILSPSGDQAGPKSSLAWALVRSVWGPLPSALTT